MSSDGEKMIVEWNNVLLRDNRKAGPFTFQAQMWKNGDIIFVYKEIPISISNISDAQHPCKLGISDAYLFNHRVPMEKGKWRGINRYQPASSPSNLPSHPPSDPRIPSDQR